MTTKLKNANPHFTFWVNNLKANEIKVFAHDLKMKFDGWLKLQDTDWLEYYGSEGAIRGFLTSKDGINSTFDEKKYPEIYEHLRPIFLARINK